MSSSMRWRNGETVDVPEAVRSWLPRLLHGRRLPAAVLSQAPEAVLDWLADEISAGFWLPVDGSGAEDA